MRVFALERGTLNRSALVPVWIDTVPMQHRQRSPLTLLLGRERTVSEQARNLA